uniref:Uncharacterized protein n=1 Tax=Candidatus Kentrum sp. LPFa TaxID=2126335 RepID=A0A450Y3Y2_9GAMM|nr:MAG: hypothetical protein BECKLPF1236C_GA0070990_105522 [Candidatus Kentron sp. LPFa]
MLEKRQKLYEVAKSRNPHRWSRETRNRNPVKEVWLPPQGDPRQGIKLINHRENNRTTSLTNTDLNTVRQISLNLIKKAKNKMSVKQTRFKAVWDGSFRSHVLANQ